MTQMRVGSVLLTSIALAGALSLAGCGPLHVHAPIIACGPMHHDEVPRDAAAASRLARQYLANIFGEPSVLRQEPFTVQFDDYRWVVRGTLPPGQTHGRFLVVLDAKTGCAGYKGADDLDQP